MARRARHRGRVSTCRGRPHSGDPPARGAPRIAPREQRAAARRRRGERARGRGASGRRFASTSTRRDKSRSVRPRAASTGSWRGSSGSLPGPRSRAPGAGSRRAPRRPVPGPSTTSPATARGRGARWVSAETVQRPAATGADGERDLRRDYNFAAVKGSLRRMIATLAATVAVLVIAPAALAQDPTLPPTPEPEPTPGPAEADLKLDAQGRQGRQGPGQQAGHRARHDPALRPRPGDARSASIARASRSSRSARRSSARRARTPESSG